jgi:hypothetical protein
MLYFRATDAERKLLPWTASPWYWGTLLVIGGVFFLAHVVGTSVPVLGKIVEAARSLEGKASLIYASPLFLAAGNELLGSINRSGITISPIANAIASTGMSTPIPFNAVAGGLAGLAIFGVISLTNQAIHTMVLLSPSMLLGSLLRILHLLALGALLLAALISPLLGALLALMLIVVCAKLAGWSFRLSVFGTVFAWDLLTFRRARDIPGSVLHRVLAFSSSAIAVPRRTLGHLRWQDGTLRFVYRPWLIGTSRAHVLLRDDLVLSQGIFYAQLVRIEGSERHSLFVLPPRYRGCESALATFADCKTMPSALKGGIRAAAAWLKHV